MTLHRIISGVIFAIIFLLGLFNPWFHWLPPLIIVIGSCWGVWEFSHLGIKHPPRAQLALSFLGAFALLLDGYAFHLDHGVLIIGLLSVLTIAAGLPLRGVDVAALAGKSVVAPIYVALPLAMIVKIWRDNLDLRPDFPNAGAHYLLFLVIVTWCGDVGAYFAGRAFGKHKLAPSLSPGKTIEGFIGGMILTIVVALCMKLFWNNIDALFSWYDVTILAITFSIIGPMGDLAESQLKRAAGAKDSGNTFTGHGGMLDIIDSLLFTTIFYFFYLSCVYPQVVN
ncbi:phosphatidate cytidylyltransferase [Candidatus Sumerlaeota bacterium]|nr:phosphatidate cytidylyltransferase [Candidatus Sumerlaeota bacterium]